MMPGVKSPNLAGTWYPADRATLAREVERLLAGVPAVGGPVPTGLLVPHAAYLYSGAAAAAGYVQVRGSRHRRVVVLAPSHHQGFRGAVVLPRDGYETPLGVMPVDRESVTALCGRPLVRADARPFEDEHALEIQLPFLQVVLPAAHLVPVLVGMLRDDEPDALAASLRGCLQAPDTLAVVSSDLTHYGARFDFLPFPPTDAATVRRALAALDGEALDCITAGDAAAFDRYLVRTGATICGRMPIAAFLRTRRPGGRAARLRYDTSLDVSGDYEHCVSYAAVAFWDA
jgi:AmmeMemoRadiSam system protein B